MKEMARLFIPTCTLLLIATLNGSTVGQVARSKSAKNAASSTSAPEKPARVLTPNQQSAIWQLDQLTEIIKDFEDDAFKIRTRAQVADAAVGECEHQGEQPAERGAVNDDPGEQAEARLHLPAHQFRLVRLHRHAHRRVRLRLRLVHFRLRFVRAALLREELRERGVRLDRVGVLRRREADLRGAFQFSRTVEFKGLEFLQKWALPNFFFHQVTAYNLLRHNGVEIGKRDYLGT